MHCMGVQAMLYYDYNTEHTLHLILWYLAYLLVDTPYKKKIHNAWVCYYSYDRKTHLFFYLKCFIFRNTLTEYIVPL
jgi:hypothetical protein